MPACLYGRGCEGFRVFVWVRVTEGKRSVWTLPAKGPEQGHPRGFWAPLKDEYTEPRANPAQLLWPHLQIPFDPSLYTDVSKGPYFSLRQSQGDICWPYDLKVCTGCHFKTGWIPQCVNPSNKQLQCLISENDFPLFKKKITKRISTQSCHSCH